METVTPGVERAIRNEVLRRAMARWAEREAAFEARTPEQADAALVAAEDAVAAVRGSRSSRRGRPPPRSTSRSTPPPCRGWRGPRSAR
jgi:hypothetical protein